MQSLQKIIVFLLLIAIVVVGYVIYAGKKITSTVENNQNTQITNNQNNTITIPPKINRIDIEKLLSENPKAGASTEELKAFSLKVSNYSVDTSVIDVSSCLPNPQVSKVSLNRSIDFKNTDSISHKLVNGKITIDVPANSTKSINPNFPSPGIFGYSCDSKIAGIFLVMP